MRFIQSCRPSQPTHLPDDLDPPVRICLPHFEDQSGAIRRVLAPYNIKVTFQPLTSLCSLILPKGSDPSLKLVWSGVSYDACYIDQTDHTLLQCLKEHKRTVGSGDRQSSDLAKHCRLTGHCIDWDGITVLGHYTSLQQCCLLLLLLSPLTNVAELATKIFGYFLSAGDIRLKYVARKHAYGLRQTSIVCRGSGLHS